jgi:hypothetical protein
MSQSAPQPSITMTRVRWKIRIDDLTTGAYSYNYWYPASGDPPFNWYVMGSLEGYGNATETEPFNNCAEIASSSYIDFFPVTVQQASTSWNAFINTGSSVDWFAWPNPRGLSPNCSWGAEYSEGYAELTWYSPE